MVGDIGRAGGAHAGIDILHAAAGRQALGRHVGPGLAAIAGHVDQAVVGARPDHARLHRRFADGIDGGIDFLAGGIDGDRIA